MDRPQMTVRQLKALPHAPVERPQTPRCDADVTNNTEHERQWRTRRYGEPDGSVFRCTRDSVVAIGDRHYCRLHGGHVALDMLLAGELVAK
jgi:hypothetical protein